MYLAEQSSRYRTVTWSTQEEYANLQKLYADVPDTLCSYMKSYDDGYMVCGPSHCGTTLTAYDDIVDDLSNPQHPKCTVDQFIEQLLQYEPSEGQ